MSETAAAPAGVATPPSAPGVLANFLGGQPFQAFAARFGAWLAALWGGPLRLGSYVLVARHADVREVFARDLDFRIAPVNAARMDAVNGPFILGMDRGATLAHERGALYQALAAVDLAPIRQAVAHEATARTESATEIDVVEGYARPIAAHTAHALFGVRGPDETTFMDVARAIFGHTFLNISGDQEIEARALRAAEMMRSWLASEIAARRASGQLGVDLMGRLLSGQPDDDLVRRTLGGMLVGSIDTTASSVAKIVAMIGRDRSLADGIAADVDEPSRLAGWCWEGLRRWPHNPIVLRRALADTTLAGLRVRSGDQVFAWTQAAMLDASAFPQPRSLRPDRDRAAYLHFGGGLHPCAGRVVNAFQIPMLVGALVRRGIRSVGQIEWAGPFPAHLPLRFER